MRVWPASAIGVYCRPIGAPSLYYEVLVCILRIKCPKSRWSSFVGSSFPLPGRSLQGGAGGESVSRRPGAEPPTTTRIGSATRRARRRAVARPGRAPRSRRSAAQRVCCRCAVPARARNRQRSPYNHTFAYDDPLRQDACTY